jgi:hypothetical protein
MFAQPLFAAVPRGVLDLTADCTPLLIGLVVTLGIGGLGMVAAIGVHDTWRTEKKVPAQPARAPQFPEAAESKGWDSSPPGPPHPRRDPRPTGFPSIACGPPRQPDTLRPTP